jgi:serine/threonine protein kinase
MKYCDACKTSYPNDFTVCPRDQSSLRVTSELMQGVILRNKYEILEKIGVGGMATVYKARHLTFNEVRALKVVSSKLLDDELFMKRFKTEAIVTRKLKHPNAVRVEDYDETDDGRPYIVMEYVEGKNLRHVIHEEKTLPVERALGIARQAAAALAAAHQLGITHRDIKPDNIILLPLPGGSDQVKVLDFGIAKLKEGSVDHTSYTPTQTGIVMGTPQYISPEQALGRTGDQVDGRADLYSLGVVLYEMLTGELPFQSDTPIGLLMHHIHTLPTPPQSLKPDLPPAVAQLLLKCLEKEREQRFQSADELLEELGRPGIAATTSALGSSTLPPARRDAAVTAPLTPMPKPAPRTPAAAAVPKRAAAVATPPGVPTPATMPLGAPVAAARGVSSHGTTPRGVSSHGVTSQGGPARVPVAVVGPEPKSNRTLYAVVVAAAVIIVLLGGYALTRPKAGPQAAATQAAADDAKVAAQIQMLLNSSPVLQKHPLTVAFAGGRAQLSGIVESQTEYELAQALTANVAGVASVDNRITVQVPEATPASNGGAAAEPRSEARVETLHRNSVVEPEQAPLPTPDSAKAWDDRSKIDAADTVDPFKSRGQADAIDDDVTATREVRVQKLVAAGDRDLESQPPNMRKAYLAFAQALRLEPGNQKAMAGLKKLEMMRRAQQQQKLNQRR